MRKGKMSFILEDFTQEKYNESCECSYRLFNEDDSDNLMSIEDYYYLCEQFAAAMGFSPKTIKEWFD